MVFVLLVVRGILVLWLCRLLCWLLWLGDRLVCSWVSVFRLVVRLALRHLCCRGRIHFEMVRDREIFGLVLEIWICSPSAFSVWLAEIVSGAVRESDFLTKTAHEIPDLS